MKYLLKVACLAISFVLIADAASALDCKSGLIIIVRSQNVIGTEVCAGPFNSGPYWWTSTLDWIAK